MSQASAVTTANFDSDVLQSSVPVLVDFWAEWCGPCRRVAPEVDAVAEEYGEKLKVRKVNVDDEQALAERYGIQGIPALLIFKGGELVDQIVGAKPRAVISAKIAPHVAG